MDRKMLLNELKLGVFLAYKKVPTYRLNPKYVLTKASHANRRSTSQRKLHARRLKKIYNQIRACIRKKAENLAVHFGRRSFTRKNQRPSNGIIVYNVSACVHGVLDELDY